jgi:hypothetical protein
MSQLIPNRYLFRFEFPLRYLPRCPEIDGVLDAWDDAYRLPSLGDLDEADAFADVFAGWNEAGLHVAVRVVGKHDSPRCEPARFWDSDNLRIMIDTRDTRNIKRATAYCRQFYLLPAGGGPLGREPVAGAARIHRAQAQAPPVPSGQIAAASVIANDGYTLEATLPTDCLPGFDPTEHPRIGFYYMLEDAELGQQFLTVGDDLNWWIDPSTWATARLER